MVSIDEITADINAALGDDDQSQEEQANTGIPKSVGQQRPLQSFVACYATSCRLSDNPNPDEAGANCEEIGMFHWKTMRCDGLVNAVAAIVGFEISEMESTKYRDNAEITQPAIDDIAPSVALNYPNTARHGSRFQSNLLCCGTRGASNKTLDFRPISRYCIIFG